jgi:hypothetical protein
MDIVLDGGLPSSCISRAVPAEEPHLTSNPKFAADALSPILSTLPVEAEVGVDGETRTVRVELRNVLVLDDPPLGTIEEQVGGSQTLSLSFPTEADTEGLFFMEITLCSGECDKRRFVYTFVEDLPDTYQRIVFERNTEIEREETCIPIPTVLVLN